MKLYNKIAGILFLGCIGLLNGMAADEQAFNEKLSAIKTGQIKSTNAYNRLGNLAALITEYKYKLKDSPVGKASFKEALDTYSEALRSLFAQTGDDKALTQSINAVEQNLKTMARNTGSDENTVTQTFENIKKLLETPHSKPQKQGFLKFNLFNVTPRA